MVGMAIPITFIVGCTGCGKGRFARALARRIGAEIISVDSMKVFRSMDIGTAKPSAADRALVPHHLIDLVEPIEDFSVARFVRHADDAIAAISAQAKPVLAVGGTALYIKAINEGLFEGPSADAAVRQRLLNDADANGLHALYDRLLRVDPESADRIHRNDRRRIVRALEVFELTGQPISTLQSQWGRRQTRYACRFVGLRRTHEDQHHRVNRRVGRMIEMGWVEEVRALLAMDAPLSRTARQALGYAQLIDHLAGRIGLDQAVESIKISTRRFCKAQRTWFRRFTETHWIDLEPQSDLEEAAERFADLEGSPRCRPRK